MIFMNCKRVAGEPGSNVRIVIEKVESVLELGDECQVQMDSGHIHILAYPAQALIARMAGTMQKASEQISESAPRILS